jgi:hypothetical protein
MEGSDMSSRAVLLVALLALGACQTAAPPAPAPAAAKEEPRGVVPTPNSFRMPQGTGCSGDIARFRAIQANDLETGHTTRTVYNEIEAEMKKAEALCAAGNSGAASAHVRGTKSRFGYPQ